MDLGLGGKRALITGGSRGIGLAVAHVLAAEGADVVIAARGEDALQRAAAEVADATGRKVVGIAADVGSDAGVDALLEQAREALGGIDILVTSAATPNTGPFPDSAFDDELNTKVKGALRCARGVAPGMQAAGWGRIVLISGLAARRTGSVVGSVRNVAVAAMAKNLADEYGPSGINCTVVHPGLTLTEGVEALIERQAEERGVPEEEVARGIEAGIAIGRIPTPEEVADVVAFLCSPRSVAVTGDAVVASGGSLGSIYY
jgi:NAD(P)-dependent dehydrogenase (short-subunit alcohol dehydrogenase family)